MSIPGRKDSKRILGSPFKSPQHESKSPKHSTLNPETQTSQLHPSPSPVRSQAEEDKPVAVENEAIGSKITCPVCSEAMITLNQLNQHIDDVHVNDEPSNASNPNTTNALSKLINNEFLNNDIKKWFSSKVVDTQDDQQPQKTQKSPSFSDSPSRRRNIKLDLLDNNKGFGLSDTSDDTSIRGNTIDGSRASESPVSSSRMKNRITRSHWKAPSSTSVCSYEGCTKTLGVRNGVVNCRKCGLLFCNDHTHYKVRLQDSPAPNNSEEPIYSPSKKGTWSRCCINCYYGKPDLVVGTEPASHDLTTEFLRARRAKVDDFQLERNKTLKRFIKLANVLLERNQSKKSSWFANIPIPLSSSTDAEIDHDDWELDNSVTNCSICYVKFGILVRKHHCRLCGKIVCDDPNNIRKGCSIYVPLARLMDKLPQLNYAPQVSQNLDDVLKDESVRFRCCVNCKNSLLYDWKRNRSQNEIDADSEAVVASFESLLTIKNQIETVFHKYDQVLGTNQSLEKLHSRAMRLLKDLESSTLRFKTDFMVQENNRLVVKPQYQSQYKLVSNMYQSIMMFSQDKLVEFKLLNSQHKQQEEQKLREAQENESRLRKVADQPPPLTKKQIRELREQLMVMNEQKFMVENMIEDFTKQRKFDELDALISNKNELSGTIADLESQLGDFSF